MGGHCHASIVILTVGHDSITKCVYVLCMTLSSFLIPTVGHDSITNVCMYLRVHA